MIIPTFGITFQAISEYAYSRIMNFHSTSKYALKKVTSSKKYGCVPIRLRS